jgi:outer membrane lipoprotein-sorting protein
MKKARTLYVLALSILIGVVLTTAQARADIYMKQKTHTGAMKVMGQSQPEKDTTMVTWLGPNKARMDQEDGTSSILLADKKVLYLINHNKKQYSEMPLDFDKMIEQATAGAAGEDPEKAKAMEKMPGFMKNMMKGVMSGMSATVTETGETKKIGSWNCRKYLIEMNMAMMGKMNSEAWATEDLKVDYGLYFTSTNAMMAAQPGFDKIVKEMQKIKGVIVSQTGTISVMGNDVTTTTELLECTDKAAPAGTYDLPAGYTKVKGFKG